MVYYLCYVLVQTVVVCTSTTILSWSAEGWMSVCLDSVLWIMYYGNLWLFFATRLALRTLDYYARYDTYLYHVVRTLCT